MELPRLEKHCSKDKEDMLEVDFKKFLTPLLMASLVILLSSMEFSTLFRTEVTITLLALTSTRILKPKKKLIRPTETTTNGAKWPLQALLNPVSSLLIELLPSTVETSGQFNQSLCHILAPIQILEQEVLQIWKMQNDRINYYN